MIESRNPRPSVTGVTPDAVGDAWAAWLADDAERPADVRTALSAVATNDSRLTNARTPVSHAASHAAAGLDPVSPSAIGAVPTSRTLAGLDLTTNRSASELRNGLSLGSAALLNVGNGPGTVAAGDDPRFNSGVAEINFDDDGIAINGTGTAATSGTSVSLSSSTGNYLPTAWAGPRVRVDDAVVSPTSWRLVARVASLTGDNTTFLVLGIIDEGTNRICGVLVNPDYLRVTAYGNGGPIQDRTPFINDGTLWICVERHGATASFFFGQGTTSAPPVGSAWTEVKIQTFTDAPGADLAIGLKTGGAATAVVDHVTLT